MVVQNATTEKIIESVPIDEIKEALFNEYKRRMIRYKMVDESLKKKYGMSYSDFEDRNIVKEEGFSWEVESDAMEWEHAIEGYRYAEQRLKDLREA
jgi:transposase